MFINFVIINNFASITYSWRMVTFAYDFLFRKVYILCHITMRMKIGQIVKFNKRMGGQVKSLSSLQFAIDYKNKNTIVRLAHITRAIAVDHPFTDANKRTTHYVIKNIARKKGLNLNDERLTKHIYAISSKNITNINNIRKRIYDAKK